MKKHGTLLWWSALIALLLLTVALRTYQLETAPPGLTHDEAANGHDSAAILRGVHRIYFPVGYGREPLYNYSTALVTAFLGQGIFTLRITTVLWSLLLWVCTVALARRWWGRVATLGTAAALTTAFWTLMMARVGLRAPTLASLLAASALAFDHAVAPRRASRSNVVLNYVLAGLLLGASLYTYMASRGMPLLYVAFLAVVILTDRALFRRIWAGALAVPLIALTAALPLLFYLRSHPQLEQRIGQLSGPLKQALAGDIAPLFDILKASLPMFFWHGDPIYLYNIGSRPALEPFLAVAFGIGLVYSLFHLRDRRFSYSLIWLAGGVAPAWLTSVECNIFRSIASLPPVFLLIGFSIAWSVQNLPRWLARRDGRWRRIVTVIVSLVLITGFAVTGVDAVRAYFATWTSSRYVRGLYLHHVVALARHLQTAGDPQIPVVVSSMYPNTVHDPYIMEVTLRREDLRVFWADTRHALVIPDAAVHLYIEEQTRPTEAIWNLIALDIQPLSRLTFNDNDTPRYTEGYRWQALATWARLSALLQTEASGGALDPVPGPDALAVTLPVVMSSAVQFVGYDAPPVAAGSAASVATAWEVLAPPVGEMAIFAHLLDAAGNIISQDDRLDAPSWQWQPGLRFVQWLTLPTPPDLAPGDYVVAVGMYDRRTGTRLSVPVDRGVMTRILLPLKVNAP